MGMNRTFRGPASNGVIFCRKPGVMEWWSGEGMGETTISNTPILQEIHKIETFEKCSFLFKFKEDENFNHRNTLSISRITILD